MWNLNYIERATISKSSTKEKQVWMKGMKKERRRTFLVITDTPCQKAKKCFFVTPKEDQQRILNTEITLPIVMNQEMTSKKQIKGTS